jgi:ubiquitin carboxyl-terminal hydrolase 8
MIKKFKRDIYNGLPNIGNTCYLNAVLQCLFSTESFINIFVNDKIKLIGNNIPITISFVNLLKVYLEKNIANPQEFLNIFSQKYKSFSGNSQQDSHEFLNHLLESIHDNLEVSKNIYEFSIKEKEYLGLLNNSNEVYLQNLIKESNNIWMKYILKENTEIIRIFYGQLRSTVECQTCFNNEHTFESFNTLQLNINHQNPKITLETCLKEFENPEIIPLDPQNSWICSKCNQRTVIKKFLQIWKLPKILIIQLKRFDLLSRKIQNEVQFPLKNLKLYDYGYNNLIKQEIESINNENPKTNINTNISQLNKFNKLFEKKYNLYGIVNHHGSSILCGHYTAMVKLKTPHIEQPETTKPYKWCILNDGSSKEVNIYTKNVSSQDTYLLFYKQKK